MINRIKKYWYLVGLAFLASLLLVIKITLRVEEEIPDASDNSWKGITPGKTKLVELQNRFEEPIRVDDKNGSKVFYYAPEKEKWATEVQLEQTNDSVQLIKRYPSSEETYQSFIDKYGENHQTFYNQDSSIGIVVLVYLDKGVALVANPNISYVQEVWYFSPMDLNTFLKTVGKDLTLEKVERF
jgi:hypothetical protein